MENIDNKLLKKVLIISAVLASVVMLAFYLFVQYCARPRAILNNIPNNYSNDKPYLWSYWEKIEDRPMPVYIEMCFKTFNLTKNDYNIQILDEKTVLDFLPNLRPDIQKLNVVQKSDYIRIALLEKYGGLWLDADTIVLTNLKEIRNKLIEGYDFIGFGCSYDGCTDNGYPRPSNGAMASQKNSILMKRCLDTLNTKIDTFDKTKNFKYFEFGKFIIWKEIDYLFKTSKYNYFHFPSYVDGSRDKTGKWIVLDYVTKTHIDLIDEDKMFFVFLANSFFCGKDEKYNQICSIKSESDILASDKFITYMFKKSFKALENQK